MIGGDFAVVGPLITDAAVKPIRESLEAAGRNVSCAGMGFSSMERAKAVRFEK
jgi:hypothetical protein